jgi:hypothetical protein
MLRRARAAAEPGRYLNTGLTAVPFEAAFVGVSPATGGVYFLYRHHRVIYIGIAVHGIPWSQDVNTCARICRSTAAGCHRATSRDNDQEEGSGENNGRGTLARSPGRSSSSRKHYPQPTVRSLRAA